MVPVKAGSAAISKAFDGEIVMIDSNYVRVHQHAATSMSNRASAYCLRGLLQGDHHRTLIVNHIVRGSARWLTWLSRRDRIAMAR